MKPIPAILLIGGGALLISSVKKVAADVESLSISIVDIDLQGGTFFQPKFLVTARVDNPTNQDFAIRSLVGDALFNGSKIGTVSAQTTFELPAKSNRDYPIDVTIETSTVIQALISLIRTGGTSGKFQLFGTLNVGGVPIPVNLDYNL